MYQECNSDTSCYKFIFKQNINCQISQKNFLLLLMLGCTIISATIEDSKRGGGHGILGQAQGEGQKISFPSLGRVTSFSTFNLKSQSPLLIFDNSLKEFFPFLLYFFALALFYVPI